MPQTKSSNIDTNDYNIIDGYLMSNIFPDFWSNVNWRDIVKEKLKELDCDLNFSVMPSDAFIETLKNEVELPDFAEPIYVHESRLDDYFNEKPTIEIVKCKSKRVDCEIKCDLDERYQHLFEEIIKEHDDFIKREDEFQESLKSKPIEKEMEISRPHLEGDIKQLQFLVDDTSNVELSELPQGYSDINLDDYEVISLSDDYDYDYDYDVKRTVSFNKEVIKHTYKPEMDNKKGHNNYQYYNRLTDKYGYEKQSFNYGLFNWIS